MMNREFYLHVEREKKRAVGCDLFANLLLWWVDDPENHVRVRFLPKLPVVTCCWAKSVKLTLHTAVRGFEVRQQVLGTGLQPVQVSVRNIQFTGAFPGALLVQLGQHIGWAPDVIVTWQAAAEFHSPVMRWRHQDDLVVLTGGVKHLPAVIVHVCK